MLQDFNKYKYFHLSPDSIPRKLVPKPNLNKLETPIETEATQTKANDIETYKREITAQKNAAFSKMQGLNNTLSSMPLPQEPNKESDKYKKQDGSFNEQEYSKDYEKYKRDLENYTKSVNKIKEQLKELQKEIEKYDVILSQLESIEGTIIPEELKSQAQQALANNENYKFIESASATVENKEVQAYITKFASEKKSLIAQAEDLNAEIKALSSVAEPNFQNYINPDGTINVADYKAAVKEFNNAQTKILQLIQQLEKLKERDKWLEEIMSELYTASSVKDFRDILINKPEPPAIDNIENVEISGSITEKIEKTKVEIETVTTQISSVAEKLNNLNNQVSPLIDAFTNAFNNAPKLEDFVEGDVPNVQAYNSAVEKYNQEQEDRLEQIESMLTEIANLEEQYDSLKATLESLKTRLEEEEAQRDAETEAFKNGLINTEFKSLEELEAYVKNSSFSKDIIIEKESEGNGKTSYKVSGTAAGIEPVSVVIVNQSNNSDDVAKTIGFIIKTIKSGNFYALNGLKEFEKNGVEVSVSDAGDKYVANVIYAAGNINEKIEIKKNENSTLFLKGSGFINEQRVVQTRAAARATAKSGAEIISKYYTGEGVVSDVQVTEGSEETQVTFNTANKDGSTSNVTIIVNQTGISRYLETTWQYDSSGNPTRQYTIDNGTVTVDLTYVYNDDGSVKNVVPTNTLPDNQNPPPASSVNPSVDDAQAPAVPADDNTNGKLSYEEWKKDKHFTNEADAQLAYEYYKIYGDNNTNSTTNPSEVNQGQEPLIFDEWAKIYGAQYAGNSKAAADAYKQYCESFSVVPDYKGAGFESMEEYLYAIQHGYGNPSDGSGQGVDGINSDSGVTVTRDEDGTQVWTEPTENGYILTKFKGSKKIIEEYENGKLIKRTQVDDNVTHTWEYEADGKTVKTHTEQYSDGAVYINGEKQSNPNKKDSVVIDDDGNKIITTWINDTQYVTIERPDGTTVEEYTQPNGYVVSVEKDRSGSIISETEVKHLPDGSTQTTIKFLEGLKKGEQIIITDNGNGQTVTKYIGGEFDGQTVTTTELPGCTHIEIKDKNGNKISESNTTSQANGTFTVTVTSYYDENGNINRKTELQQSAAGKQLGEYTKVGDKFVLKSTKVYDTKGQQTSETNYQYDPITGVQVSRVTTGVENGQPVVVVVRADGTTKKTVTNPDGTTTITTKNKDGSSYTTRCDTNGNPIETVIDNGQGKKQSFNVNNYMNSDGTYKSKQIVDFWKNYNQVVSFTNQNEINAFINFYNYALSGNCDWTTWYSAVTSGNFDTNYWAKQGQRSSGSSSHSNNSRYNGNPNSNVNQNMGSTWVDDGLGGWRESFLYSDQTHFDFWGNSVQNSFGGNDNNNWLNNRNHGGGSAGSHY